MYALPLSSTTTKLALPVSMTPSEVVDHYWPVSATPVRDKLTSVNNISNACMAGVLILLKCVQIPILFFTELILYILNFFDTELISYRTFWYKTFLFLTYLIPNLFDIEFFYTEIFHT
jgi:hypothetical protein